MHPEFHTSLLKPYNTDPDPKRMNKPNEGMMGAGGIEDAMLIGEIRGHKMKKKQIYYLVKWLGCPDSDNSWESLATIAIPAYKLIEGYVDKYNLDKSVWNPPLRRSKRNPSSHVKNV